MDKKPTYSELQKKVDELQQIIDQYNRTEYPFKFKNKDFAQAILEKAAVLIFVKDIKGRYILSNREFDRKFKLKPGEVIGKTDFNFMPKKMADKCHQQDNQVVKHEKTVGFEEKAPGKKDAHTSIVIKAPMYDNTGKLYGICGISADITEQNKVAEKLRKSRLKYRNLIENLSDALFDGDKNGRFKFINKAGGKLLGASAKDLIGKTLLPYLTKESQKLGIDLYQRCMQGEDISAYDLILKNGKTVQFRNKTVRDHENKLVSVFGIGRDITEQKMAEEKIRQSEARLRQVIDLVPHIIFAKDRAGRFVLANKAICEVYKTTVDNIIGKTDTDFNPHKKVVEQFLKEDREVMDSGEKKDIPEFKIVDQKGNIRYQHTIKIPFTLSMTKNDAILGVSTDITEVTLAKKALKEYQVNLEKMVKKRTEELKRVNIQLKNDKKILKAREKELKDATKDLNELNVAMNALLKRRAKDKIELEKKILANVKELVTPYIKKMGKTRMDNRQNIYYNIVKSNLEDIVSPFLYRLSSEYHGLTPREIQVSDLVRQGYTSNTIAELVGSSVRAVEFHRKNLRKKLGLTNRKANLRSHLLSLK